ncbi:MAG: tetratricopeptide repeat protein [Bacteroidales bacterium]|jgi:tetratricopeptide (TPR) repeat protein|nr:tetratricopeptide repeat protein [Bacteroidales bacterium]
MKKLSITILTLVLFSISYGQSTKINNAFNELRKGRVARALVAIEDAAVHPATKDQARTWFYRGNVYYMIAASTDPAVKSLRENALDSAYAFYQKAISIDEKISNNMLEISSPIVGSRYCGDIFFNRGIGYYNQGEFQKAYEDFDKANTILKNDNNTRYMAGLAAFEAQRRKPEDEAPDYRETKRHFNALVRADYKESQVYIVLSEIFKAENDTSNAIKTVDAGVSKFGDDTKILIQKFNIFLWADKTDEALEMLQVIKDKDPTNHVVFFNLGTVLNELGQLEQAEIALKQAIELNEEYFDAYYNLGTMYYNRFLNVLEEANDLPFSEQKRYKELMDHANEFLASAKPHLEKCRELQPKDYNTLFMLKQVYSRTSELDKAMEVDKELQELDD